ncbi:MAG: CBS domain-containing protein [Gammaproteobacteria bacterium]|nr:CBS domain-containing protein [Gammaproteobacteria bacterium]
MSDTPQPRRPRAGWWRRLMRRLGSAPLSREDLRQALHEASRQGLIDPDAAEMIGGVFESGELQVRDIMIPRAQMVVIERDWPLQRLLQTAVESGHSRFPVIGDSRDEVVGILLAKDLLRCTLDTDPGQPLAVERWLRPALFVPESKRVNVLLREFKRGRNHMAIVADEYGGVAGLVTIEDVLETIVGEIEDEYDESESAPILKLDQRRYSIKGLTPIEEFNRYFGAEFSDADFDTVAGLVVHAFGRMPRRGESVRIGRFQFNVQRAGSRRVDLLQVTLAQN